MCGWYEEITPSPIEHSIGVIIFKGWLALCWVCWVSLVCQAFPDGMHVSFGLVWPLSCQGPSLAILEWNVAQNSFIHDVCILAYIGLLFQGPTNSFPYLPWNWLLFPKIDFAVCFKNACMQHWRLVMWNNIFMSLLAVTRYLNNKVQSEFKLLMSWAPIWVSSVVVAKWC